MFGIKEIISDLWCDGFVGRGILLVLAIVISTFPLVIYSHIQEEKRWNQFCIDHKCRKVGEMKGSVQTGFGYGMTSSGQFGTVITTSGTPDKTAWLCDDGVTYWRE